MTRQLTPRRLSDQYVDALIDLDPVTATTLGLPAGADRLRDLSPDGLQAFEDLRVRTLAQLDALEAAAGPEDLVGEERSCARLLRDRLSAQQARYLTGEDHRSLTTLFSPLQSARLVFTLMPTSTEADWEVIARRMSAVPEAIDGYVATLAEGRRRGLPVGPAQVDAVIAQLGQWLAAADGAGWYHQLAARGPERLHSELAAGATAADGAVARLRAWLRTEYAPFAHETGRDAVGRERYAVHARYWTGADVDLDEAYAWAWGEFARLDAELRAEARRVLPGASVKEAMHHLETEGPAIDGVDSVIDYLQGLMDGAIAALDGVHFDLAEPLRRVEARVAPEGSAAAPYYTEPSLDFSRPGRTWLPLLGRTRFPRWDLVSTWYHEGVPGHHLQLGQWVYRASALTRFQTVIGAVSANLEGWALYAERLMDELGFLTDPGDRLGYLDAQQMRAVRVIIDIGMHCELVIPRDQGVPEPFAPGERWTPALAREFFGNNSGRPADFIDSELVRYLGGPGQAIGYKLGERAWLAGREAARSARTSRGKTFDAKAWHMAALSQGSLGLDDLVAELSAL